mmetsp:Transcript_11894/g.23935  ORF Transcript_11894/g.23935 Transcript_11894/m.23935 type:complete len:85 (-) Transcript_11894:524-778(-)
MQWQVQRLAKRLLDEATDAERRRKEAEQNADSAKGIGRFNLLPKSLALSFKVFQRSPAVLPTDSGATPTQREEGGSEMTAPSPL